MSEKPHTVEEYFATELASDERFELIDGEIRSLSGATLRHARIVGHLIYSLTNQLHDDRCEPLFITLRVKLNPRDYTYPDAVVVCDEPQLEKIGELETLLNPTLIIEVLSPTSEVYDRTRKFELYKQIKSLREYVLIAQDRPRIERYLRQENDEWLYTDAAGIEASLDLQSIGCRLVLADVYELVTFEE